MWVPVICILACDDHSFTPLVLTSHEARGKEVRRVPFWMSFMFSDVYVFRLVLAAFLMVCVKGTCC